jgi:N-acetylglucosamine-6-phosphate deacetylase
MQFLARRYDTHELATVEVHGERILRVRSAAPRLSDQGRVPWIAPGLVDIQVNGYGGQEFSSPQLTAERVAAIVRRHFAFGVTRLCPTLTTQSFDVLAHGMRAIDTACQSWPDVERAVAGIHLEGPYFSTDDGPRGAHPKEHCRRPDWDEFGRLQEAAGGRIVVLTMSPEFDESADFIARVVSSGVVVAIGHTGADGVHIRAAVDAGARLSTHLGNGAHRVLRRHPNYIWDQLAEDRLTASLIVDGHHLPPEVVKTFVRAKTPARCVLVSDVSGLAGLPAGRYTSSGCELEILADGRLVIAGQDQLLAGASLPIGVGVANVMRFAGVDLKTAIDMASRQPAELLRKPAGGLCPGDPADLVLFDLPEDLAGGTSMASSDRANTGLTIRATIVAGRVVFGEIP